MIDDQRTVSFLLTMISPIVGKCRERVPQTNEAEKLNSCSLSRKKVNDEKSFDGGMI